jgi:hypothetical protein
MPARPRFFGRIGSFFGRLFKRKKRLPVKHYIGQAGISPLRGVNKEGEHIGGACPEGDRPRVPPELVGASEDLMMKRIIEEAEAKRGKEKGPK